MIEMNFDQIDVQRFQLNMKKYPSIMVGEFRGLINKLTLIAEREIKDAVRSGPTRAFDTGNLMNLIRGSMLNTVTGQVVSAAPYSLYVHAGTKYMRARPYMTQGLDNSRNSFNKLIDEFLNKVFKQ